MRVQDTKVIKDTINKVSGCVTQTMGARGRLAVISDEFSRPLLTDDGVTVARQFMNLDDPFEKMVALSICEAAGNTERSAFDGTTLTCLLIKEFYNLGLEYTSRLFNRMHPQNAADKIQDIAAKMIECLKENSFKLEPKQVSQLAYITTKMPKIGQLVHEAYNKAGPTMNVLIEHDRKLTEHKVEYTTGVVLDYGYFATDMQALCNDEAKQRTSFKAAHCVLLQEGILSQRDIVEFFRSIPQEAASHPFVFFITNAFNQESLKMLLDSLVENKMKFQFVFVNEPQQEEMFTDLAARTNGQIQSAAHGTSSYKFEHCGLADEITIEIDKTVIICKGDAKRIKARVAAYEKELKDTTYTLSAARSVTINRRLANLQAGVVKIKLGCATSTEYMTIKLKLDDAIGAVRCAAKDGLVLGGGKAIWNLKKYKGYFSDRKVQKLLEAPLRTILANAGIKLTSKMLWQLNTDQPNGYNVITKEICYLMDAGLVDSYSSVEKAIANAASIASHYIRAYCLIKS